MSDKPLVEQLMECEATDLVKRYYPHQSNKLKEYLAGVEKQRGAESANKLRLLCREKWMKKKVAA